MDSCIQEAVRDVLSRRIVLPRSALEIPIDCLVYSRPIVVWARTEDFLKLLDSEVRKSPAEGMTLKAACELMNRLGGSLSENALMKLLSRTMPLHVLTVHKNRVRLSTAEALEKIKVGRSS